MRILHTSDWHLGKTLEGRDRLPEQAQFIDELVELVRDRNIDLVLISGDIFDTYNPSAAAEQLYYEALCRISDNGRRGVIVIAGNHDNPERLSAAAPMAEVHGVYLAGFPKTMFSPQVTLSGKIREGVRAVNGGTGWLELAHGDWENNAIILTLAYPSEARLKEVISISEDEKEQQQAYSRRVGRFFQGVSSNFKSETINLVTSHLYIAGSEDCESERPIQLGGTCAVYASDLPAADYTALGHLHRAQGVGEARSPARYSGSPLAYSFSESGQTKSVVIADITRGKATDIELVPVRAGRALVRWRAQEGIEQVLRWIEAGRDAGSWIDLEIHGEAYLTANEIHTLREACPHIVNIRPVITGSIDIENREAISGKPIDELFRLFYQRRLGALPDDAIVDLFLELVQEEGESAVETDIS